MLRALPLCCRLQSAFVLPLGTLLRGRGWLLLQAGFSLGSVVAWGAQPLLAGNRVAAPMLPLAQSTGTALQALPLRRRLTPLDLPAKRRCLAAMLPPLPLLAAELRQFCMAVNPSRASFAQPIASGQVAPPAAGRVISAAVRATLPFLPVPLCVLMLLYLLLVLPIDLSAPVGHEVSAPVGHGVDGCCAACSPNAPAVAAALPLVGSKRGEGLAIPLDCSKVLAHAETKTGASLVQVDRQARRLPLSAAGWARSNSPSLGSSPDERRHPANPAPTVFCAAATARQTAVSPTAP